MNPETRAALAGCSAATLTMQLLKQGLLATAMRGVRPLASGQGRERRERPGGFTPETRTSPRTA